MIRAAKPEEAQLLSDLALRSKAHWDYDPAFIEACRPALTVTHEKIATAPVYVAEKAGQIVGFYALRDLQDGCVDLDYLFVEPGAIGHGYGTQLWKHAVETARGLQYHTLVIEADPNAENFYLAMGAQRVGQAESTVLPGRMVPLLHFQLK